MASEVSINLAPGVCSGQNHDPSSGQTVADKTLSCRSEVGGKGKVKFASILSHRFVVAVGQMNDRDKF